VKFAPAAGLNRCAGWAHFFALKVHVND